MHRDHSSRRAGCARSTQTRRPDCSKADGRRAIAFACFASTKRPFVVSHTRPSADRRRQDPSTRLRLGTVIRPGKASVGGRRDRPFECCSDQWPQCPGSRCWPRRSSVTSHRWRRARLRQLSLGAIWRSRATPALWPAAVDDGIGAVAAGGRRPAPRVKSSLGLATGTGPSGGYTRCCRKWLYAATESAIPAGAHDQVKALPVLNRHTARPWIDMRDNAHMMIECERHWDKGPLMQRLRSAKIRTNCGQHRVARRCCWSSFGLVCLSMHKC